MELHLQESILVLLIQLGLNKKVLNMTLDWDGKEAYFPKYSYKVGSDSPRNMSRDTDRIATSENYEISMPFSRD